MPHIKATLKIPESVKNFKRYPEIFKKVTNSRLKEALVFTQNKVQEYTHVGAGPAHLRENIFEKIMDYGEKVIGVLGVKSESGIGGNPIEYTSNVEWGHSPYFIGKGVIETKIKYWVENVLHYSGKEALGVAWAIAKTIGNVGYSEHEMFKKGTEDSEYMIMSILNSIPAGIVEELSKS